MTVRAQPDYPEAIQRIGDIVDAMLGNKEDAVKRGRRAVELMPISRDAIVGPTFVRGLAIIYGLVGERDLAFEQLEAVTRIPGYTSYGELRLDPIWDSLRA